MIANVPQLDPTENAIKPESRKMSGANINVGTFGPTTLATYGPVPSRLATSPRARENNRIVAMGSRLLAPFMKMRMSSLIELSPLMNNMIQAKTIAVLTAHRMETDPEP